MNPLSNNSSFNGPLTPHHFRTNQNLNQGQAEGPGEVSSKSSSKIRYVPLVIAGLALLILPITVWQINTQQDIRQRASEQKQQPREALTLARVGDEVITETDVDFEYANQQNATSYLATPTALKSQILNALVRKKVIANLANERNITVTEDEIESKIKMLKSFNQNLKPNRSLVSDIVLEEKLALTISPSVIANIAFSNNASVQTQSFFKIIRTQSASGNSLLEIARPYSTQSRDVKLLENIPVAQNSDMFTPEVLQKVFDLEVGDISDVFQDKNRFFIVEAINKTAGEGESFENYIEQQISQQAQILTGN